MASSDHIWTSRWSPKKSPRNDSSEVRATPSSTLSVSVVQLTILRPWGSAWFPPTAVLATQPLQSSSPEAAAPQGSLGEGREKTCLRASRKQRIVDCTARLAMERHVMHAGVSETIAADRGLGIVLKLWTKSFDNQWLKRLSYAFK
jgi:hypothetical protein